MRAVPGPATQRWIAEHPVLAALVALVLLAGLVYLVVLYYRSR